MPVTHHNDKVDFAPAGKLDAMEPVKARKERVRVVLNVGVIGRQDRAQEAVLGMADSFDDKLEVA